MQCTYLQNVTVLQRCGFLICALRLTFHVLHPSPLSILEFFSTEERSAFFSYGIHDFKVFFFFLCKKLFLKLYFSLLLLLHFPYYYYYSLINIFRFIHSDLNIHRIVHSNITVCKNCQFKAHIL